MLQLLMPTTGFIHMKIGYGKVCRLNPFQASGNVQFANAMAIQLFS